ncbi:MAG: hypothetical protein FWF77_01905 [Defluviitaleaceae bacterium]|nr:hypothetical protein [Defluviitaleaceae bacterium]
MFETDKFHNESVIKERAEKRGGNLRALEIARKMKKAGRSLAEIIEFTRK